MDAAALRSRIQATLDANAEIRKQAEGELKAVSNIKMGKRWESDHQIVAWAIRQEQH